MERPCNTWFCFLVFATSVQRPKRAIFLLAHARNRNLRDWVHQKTLSSRTPVLSSCRTCFCWRWQGEKSLIKDFSEIAHLIKLTSFEKYLGVTNSKQVHWDDAKFTIAQVYSAAGMPRGVRMTGSFPALVFKSCRASSSIRATHHRYIREHPSVTLWCVVEIKEAGLAYDRLQYQICKLHLTTDPERDFVF